MARTEDKEKAIKLRLQGMSYSQIKDTLGVSKSTLSGWLHGMPLPPERLKQLKNTDAQIEKTRKTKARKKADRRKKVYKKVSNDIKASIDIRFVSGFYLYWGEGTKTAEYTTSFTNSDPAMVRCFVDWIELLGVSRSVLRLKLHVYSDQDEKELRQFWSKAIGVPIANFNKSYTKEAMVKSKTYKGTFGYGTCVVAYHDRDMHEYVLAGIEYLRDRHAL